MEVLILGLTVDSIPVLADFWMSLHTYIITSDLIIALTLVESDNKLVQKFKVLLRFNVQKQAFIYVESIKSMALVKVW